MKKSFPANINGVIFYIDEDAYELLNTYLDQLRKAFPGEEGREIVADIEGRISEIFAERVSSGANVIVIDDVNSVIEQMGQPTELSDAEDDTDSPDINNTDTTPPPFTFEAAQPQVRKRLYRDMRDKVFGGVLSGIAAYMNWNVNILRLLIIVLAIVSTVWPLVVAYLLAWMIIPPARTAQQYLELTGKPVTVGNVGQTILSATDDNHSLLYTVLSILGKCAMILAGIIASSVAVGFVVMLILGIAGVILYGGWNSTELFYELDLFDTSAHPLLGGIGIIVLSLAVLIPCIAIIWGVCSALFKIKGLSTTAVISIIIIEILAIISSIVLLTLANSSVIMFGSCNLAAPAVMGAISFFPLLS